MVAWHRWWIVVLFLCGASSYAQDENGDGYDENPVITIDFHVIKKGETIYKLAQLFDLGFDEILQANPNITDPKLIQVGEKIILPTAHLIPDVKREGIAINLAELRLYFFVSENDVISFPISIGTDEKTPVGKTKIAEKRKNPSWIPPPSIREENPKLPEIVPPGPDNPLGEYALYLDSSRHYKWHNIAIHGTNAPWTIGSRVSHGCIRLYPKDIKILFQNIEIGTSVEIVNQPIKVLEIGNKIYLEVHLKEAPELVLESMGIKKLICKKIQNCELKISWRKVDEVVMQNTGVPMEIGN